ncbi:MAG: hypothetical protein U0Y96_01165 [Candidatus Kapaibacterium sp.]|nr:hypothetical protein [Bacteroidota bacterium]
MELILIVIILFLSPAVVLLILGFNRLYTQPKSAKILLIAAGVYLLIGLGICGSMLSGL